MKKRHQLTNGENGVYWAIAKHKIGYLTLNNKHRSLLIVNFNNDHPHVVVLPNSKDILPMEKRRRCKTF